MPEALAALERIARRAHGFTETDRAAPPEARHPFQVRDIHESLPPKVRELFDDGHYAQATYEAYKYLDSEVRRLSKIDKTGVALMMEALNKDAPKLKLNALVTMSEKDEQEGFRFLFAGGIAAIRNPRGHEGIEDDLETSLAHLSLATLLMRRLERAGYALS
jgi:uncharacterized protein (TIGR02391 family)